MKIEEHFSQENIINNLARYEMYYQVALGSLISSTKAKEMSYDIDFQLALGSIYELLKDLETIEDEEITFEEELRKQSAMDAVQNFVNENLELVKKGELEVEPIVNHINDGLFFNEALEEICNQNLDSQIIKWQEVITNDLASAIMESLKQLENQQN